MTKREYLSKRSDLQTKLKKIDDELAAAPAGSRRSEGSGIDTKTISRFMVLHQLMGNANIRETYSLLDKEVMRDFFGGIIKGIVMEDKKVMEIRFQGNIVHKLIYA
jgi:hypothetical protein